MAVAAVPPRLVGVVPVEGRPVDVGVGVEGLAFGVEARNEQFALGEHEFHRRGLPVTGGCVRRQGDFCVIVVRFEGILARKKDFLGPFAAGEAHHRFIRSVLPEDFPFRRDGLSGAVQGPGADPGNGKHGFERGELVFHQVHTLEEDLFTGLRGCCPHEIASLGEVCLHRCALLREDLISFLQNRDRHVHGFSFSVQTPDFQVRVESGFHDGIKGFRKLGGAVCLKEQSAGGFHDALELGNRFFVHSEPHHVNLRNDPLVRQGLRSRAGISAAAFKTVGDEDDHLAAGKILAEILRRLLERIGDGSFSLGLDLPDEALHFFPVQGADGDFQFRVLAVVCPVAVHSQPDSDSLPFRQVVDNLVQRVLCHLNACGSAQFRPHASRSVKDELNVGCGVILGQGGAPGTRRQEEEKEEQYRTVHYGTIHNDQPP